MEQQELTWMDYSKYYANKNCSGFLFSSLADSSVYFLKFLRMDSLLLCERFLE